MKSWIVKMLVTVIAIAVATLLVTKYSPPFPISSVVTQKTDFFTVNGSGKVTVVPDTALVNLGISVSQSSVKTAQSQVNGVMAKITADLKTLGIDPKDIQTGNYSVNPEYDYRSGNNPRITGYRVSTDIEVTVKNLDNINSVIDTGTADGANTVGGISLIVNEDRQKELTKEARAKAVTEAKTKAVDLAGAAGLSLGRLINVSEGNNTSPRPVFMDSAKVGLGGGSAPATDIQPGSTDITSDITLTYEVR